MFLLLCSICCVLILPVFAVGMAALQNKLLMLSRRSPGHLSDGGWRGKVSLAIHSRGRLRLLACLVLVWRWSARPWDPKLWAGRKGRKRWVLPTGLVIWWRRSLYGAGLGQQMLVEDLPRLSWGRGSDAYVTWHVRIRETMRKHAWALHTVTPRGSELWGQSSTVHAQTGWWAQGRQFEWCLCFFSPPPMVPHSPAGTIGRRSGMFCASCEIKSRTHLMEELPSGLSSVVPLC